MLRPFFLAFSLITCTANTARAVTLFEGLRNANATKFAAWIQSDPALVELFTAPDVRTVYAPIDEAVPDFNTSVRMLLRARAPDKSQIEDNAALQAGVVASDAATLGTPPGSVNPTKDPGPLNGSSPVTSQGRKPNVYRRARQVDGSEQPIQLFSGLGDNVTVIKTDVPYDGGIIHTVTDFFTAPQNFTSTFKATNQTSFSNGLESAGLNSTFSHPSGVTIFSTSDSAYAAGTSNSSSTAQISSILSNHVIPGFLGYLPFLRDGQKLKTLGGTTLTVHIREDVYYINEAKIVKADLITDNGVAHVLDKILAPPGIVPFTGSVGSLTDTKPGIAACMVALLLAVGM